MDDKLKKRLVGAAVLASLVVIFVPMLVEKRADPPVVAPLPEPPPAQPMAFDSHLLREEVPAPQPPPPPVSAPAAPGGEVPGEDLEPRVGLRVWVVQVGSFESRENAERLVGKLRDAGIDTMDADAIGLRGRTLYRVQVGPQVDRAGAEALLPRIKEVTGLDGKVFPYP